MKKRFPVKKPKAETQTTILKLSPELDNAIRKDAANSGQTVTAWFRDAAERKLAEPR